MFLPFKFHIVMDHILFFCSAIKYSSFDHHTSSLSVPLGYEQELQSQFPLYKSGLIHSPSVFILHRSIQQTFHRYIYSLCPALRTSLLRYLTSSRYQRSSPCFTSQGHPFNNNHVIIYVHGAIRIHGCMSALYHTSLALACGELVQMIATLTLTCSAY